jgi:8-oxo-dGTP pyrophosphatase MutT (NUDIX family)
VSLVRAAGGLVLRDGEVLLVHRPRYDDWTFPKGKCDIDESDEACALREVHEETGLVCRLAGDGGTTEYVDSKGRHKRVRWWLMEPLEGEFTPNDEVDEVRWAEPTGAARLLSYDRDLALLATLP